MKKKRFGQRSSFKNAPLNGFLRHQASPALDRRSGTAFSAPVSAVLKRASRLWLPLLLTLAAVITQAQEVDTVALPDGRYVILFEDYTWRYLDAVPENGDLSHIQDNQVPEFLRQGINADRDQIISAVEMYNQGWRYIMPRPKSRQAAWGNSDGRTTWYNGWWVNENTGRYSRSTPVKSANGIFIGDAQNESHTWRRGGSPARPDIYMWLLSESGGPSR